MNVSPLKDHVALVTGSAKGIGLGCARSLARDGARVVLTDIDDAGGRAAADALTRQDYDVSFRHLNVTDFEQIKKTFAEVHERFGRFDILVNNAGFHNGKGLLECSPEDWDSLLDLNLKSAFLCAKAVFPYMKGSGGSIVNIASCTGLRGQNKSVAYSASKGGMIAMTRALALELAPFHIRVNAICPGNVDTPLMASWIATQQHPEELRRHISEAPPLGRMATIDEIGDLAAFLAGPRSSYITGEPVVIDGGVTLGY